MGRFSVSHPIEANGGTPVNVQDQTSRMLDLDFIKALAPPTTLVVDTAPGDRTIRVSNTAGFAAGVVVGITNVSGIFYFGEQVGALAGDVVTLDTPVDKIFDAATSNVIVASRDMAVDGSLTTQVFQIGGFSTPDLRVDITRVHGYLQSGSAMDDSLFGSLAPLTYGIVLRKNDDIIENFWNAKTNGRLAKICGGDFNYTASAPAGSNGARFRNTFAGAEKHGVTVRLGAGETFEVLIQDDLTGLEAFEMMAQGHFVAD